MGRAPAESSEGTQQPNAGFVPAPVPALLQEGHQQCHKVGTKITVSAQRGLGGREQHMADKTSKGAFW